MHNLFLGTAKHIFTIWIETGLTKDKLSLINDTILHFVVPNNIGRVPSNIASNYLSFKAAQWSTWTTIYSPVALKNIYQMSITNAGYYLLEQSQSYLNAL